MQTLTVPYSKFKAMLQVNTAWPIRERVDASGASTLWSMDPNREFLFNTNVLAEDASDWTAFKATRTVGASSNEAEAIVDLFGIKYVHNRRTEDGREMIQPVTLDRGLWHWYHSAGDVLGGSRGADSAFELSVTSGSPTATREWQYNDWVEMAGGVGNYVDADIGDWVEFKLWFPASVGTSTPGTGNANKVSIGGGLNMFVPAANGDWTITLTDRTSVVPVSADNVDGYWDWDWPDTGVGTVVANASGKGYYNLFDFAIDPATRFIPRVSLLGSGEARFLPENVHPTDVLPHWRLKATLHHSGGSNTLKFVWHVVAARKVTT